MLVYAPDGTPKEKDPVDARECVEHCGFTFSPPEKQEKQSLAVAAIEQDPLVRTLVENFDAKVIESSIKPL